MALQPKSGVLPSPLEMWPHLYMPTRQPPPGANGEPAWPPPSIQPVSSIANSVQDDSDDDLLAAGIAFDAARGSAVAEAINTADALLDVHGTSILHVGLATEPTNGQQTCNGPGDELVAMAEAYDNTMPDDVRDACEAHEAANAGALVHSSSSGCASMARAPVVSPCLARAVPSDSAGHAAGIGARVSPPSPPGKRQRTVGLPLMTSSGLLDFTKHVAGANQILHGLDFSTVLARPVSSQARTEHMPLLELQDVDAQDMLHLTLFQENWVDAVLRGLPDEHLAACLRRMPMVALEGILQPVRFGLVASHANAIDQYLRRVLHIWPVIYGNMSVTAAGCQSGAQLVRIGVVHISTGHGTGIACAENAVGLLQDVLRQHDVFPVLCSAQHLLLPWTSCESHGDEILMAGLWKPRGHATPPFQHHLLKWDKGNAAEVATMCQAECMNAAVGGQNMVMLLVDLLPFNVAEAVKAQDGSDVQTALRQLQAWIKRFEQIIDPSRMVKVFADMRPHDVACMTWLGQHLSPAYTTNASDFTGVDRVATICASPCVSHGHAGGTLADLTSGAQQRFIVPHVQNVEQFVNAPLRDGTIWSPQGCHRENKPRAPSGLTHEWPLILRELVKLTDAATDETRSWVDMHRCERQTDHTIGYCGPAYFFRMLSWEDTPYEDVLLQRPCSRKIYVMNGEAAPEVVPDVGYGHGSWTASCGDVVLCNQCSAVVEALGCAWERSSMSDVIARHTAARIFRLCKDVRSIDCNH